MKKVFYPEKVSGWGKTSDHAPVWIELAYNWAVSKDPLQAKFMKGLKFTFICIVRFWIVNL